MYSIIINPDNAQPVPINTPLGKLIINNYIKSLFALTPVFNGENSLALPTKDKVATESQPAVSNLLDKEQFVNNSTSETNNYLAYAKGGAQCQPLRKSLQFNIDSPPSTFTDVNCPGQSQIGYDEELHKYCCYSSPSPNIGKHRPIQVSISPEITERYETDNYESDLSLSRKKLINDLEYKRQDFLEITVGIVKSLIAIDPPNRQDKLIKAIMKESAYSTFDKIIMELKNYLIAKQKTICTPEITSNQTQIITDRETQLKSIIRNVTEVVETRIKSSATLWEFLDEHSADTIEALALEGRHKIYSGEIDADEDILELFKLKDTYVPRTSVEAGGGDDLFSMLDGDNAW
tara:strand:+ start:54 stop:1097 length:1044 start_codon:yes stop_codon:yes gene_type:complete